ncbi:MAG TPA: DUF4203 domain-containing protein [Anaerolineae bacterium]|nr:DUF4203 domain-containing protein [Anaerolineae bacterium]
MGNTVVAALDGTGPLVAVVIMLAGLAVCFYGFRLLRIVLALAGFAVGTLLGYLLAGLLGVSEDMVWIVVLLGGVICGFLATVVYKLGVFLLGAAAGYLLGSMIGAHLGANLPLLVPIGAALLGGILALVSQRAIVALATALSGSWVAVRAGAALLGGASLRLSDLFDGALAPGSGGAASVGFLVAWGLLALAGALVQLRARK